MGKQTRAHHHLFFLVVLIILLLAFFASGMHNGLPPPQKPEIQHLYKTPYRFTQPQPSKDPPGNIMFGQECGKPGASKDLLDCQGKEGYGYCMSGYRCRQTGFRFQDKCLCR